MEGTNKKSQSVGVFPSPRLQFLMLELLLDYLDFSTLQTLRLVSKTTKGWVETPKHLRHFVVRITSKARLDDVLGAPDPVPWNSFLFTGQSNCLASADVRRFLVAYGDLVLHLELNAPTMRNRLCLLSGCPQLESIRSQQLFMTDEMIHPLLENWKNLRHLRITRFISHKKRRPDMGMAFFSQLISACSQLETLTFPDFIYCAAPVVNVGYSLDFQPLVITPLLDTLARGRLRSVTASRDGFTDELFLRLAFACRATGTVLHIKKYDDFGVQVGLSKNFLDNLPPEHLPLLDIIGSLYGVTDSIIRRPLTNVRRIHLTSSDFRVVDHAYKMPQFPHLSQVQITFDCDKNPVIQRNQASLQMFIHRLVKASRPTVKSSRLFYPNSKGMPLGKIRQISPVILCSSFVKLRVLHVEHWEGEDEEWLKLWPLVGHTLVELKLWNCLNLSNRGILGDDLKNAAFLHLKQLRNLTLWSREEYPRIAKITEPSFIHAFRHMRLRSFVFYEDTLNTINRLLIPKTVKAMWSGPLGETIEHFVVQNVDLIPQRPRSNQKMGRVSDVERNATEKRSRSQCSIN